MTPTLFGTALLFGCFALLACEGPKPTATSKPIAEASARVTTPAVGSNARPSAPAWSAPSGSAARNPHVPPPTAAACPTKPAEYFVRVQGRGEPLELRVGAPWFPFPLRNCEPAQHEALGGAVVSACADTRDVRKGCLLINPMRAAYFDRDGKYRTFDVRKRSLRRSGNVVDGTLELVAAAEKGLPAETLEVTVHVGANVPTVADADAWKNTDPNRFPD